MADLTPKHRRRGLEFANRVAELASTAPDSVAKTAVFGAVKRLREFYGFSDEQKRTEIRKSLVLGCSTYDDLVNETKLHRPTVIEIVKDMQTAGEVELRTLQRGGQGGRPMVYIYLADESASKITLK